MSNLRQALDFIAAAETAPTMERLQEILGKTLLEFGVTQYSLVAAATRPDNKARRPIGLSRACEPAWSECYLDGKYYNSDPVVHAAISQSAPFSWIDLAPHLKAPSAKQMIEEGRDLMKVDGCLVIPTHDAQGFAGFISMFHAGRAPDEAMSKALKLIAIYAVEKAKELHGVTADGAAWDVSCPLTNRQREVLAFSAIGKTDWEIAKILGVSAKTANFHLERAKAKLEVATRAQAIAIAVHRGWVAL